MKLPTWHEVDYHRFEGHPLDYVARFIFEHEPSNRKDAEKFRRDLRFALNNAAAYGLDVGLRGDETADVMWTEPTDAVYGSLTAEEKSRYYDIEDARNHL